MMNVKQIINELKAERDRIAKAIITLESLNQNNHVAHHQQTPFLVHAQPKKSGAKWTPERRRKMERYWASHKKAA